MLTSGESITLPSWLSWMGNNVVGPSLPVWVAWSMIIVMDMITAIILAYNWWFGEFIITHIPPLNRAYARLQKKAEKLRKKKLLSLSLLIFMIIPFQGTGSISTTIIARALTYPVKKTVTIVFVGSLITTTLWIAWWLGFFKFL